MVNIFNTTNRIVNGDMQVDMGKTSSSGTGRRWTSYDELTNKEWMALPNLTVKKKFCLWPAKCNESGKSLWLRMGIFTVTDHDQFIVKNKKVHIRWFHPANFTMLKIIAG